MRPNNSSSMRGHISRLRSRQGLLIAGPSSAVRYQSASSAAQARLSVARRPDAASPSSGEASTQQPFDFSKWPAPTAAEHFVRTYAPSVCCWVCSFFGMEVTVLSRVAVYCRPSARPRKCSQEHAHEHTSQEEGDDKLMQYFLARAKGNHRARWRIMKRA